MSGSNSTSVAYLFKTTYAGDLGDVTRRRHTLLAQTTKTGGFTGKNFTYPMKFGNPGAVGGGFTTNQTNVNSSSGVQFAALRFIKYGIIQLDGPSLRSCDSKGAFATMVMLETDGVIQEQNQRLGFDIYRDGSGNRGQQSSISGNIITLVDAQTTRNFEPNMVLIASTSAAGTAPRTGSTYVTAVSLTNGTITVNSAAAITGLSNNDYLFAAGDPGTCMEGLELCTPLSEPLNGDSFRGVDRSVYPARLAGSRRDDTSTVIESNTGRVAVDIDAAGGMVDSVVYNPINFYQVQQRLNAKVIYEPNDKDPTWGFETLKIATAAGVLTVYSDPDCPTNRARLYRKGAMYLRTLDELVHTITDDNNGPSMRVYNADSIEIRIRSMVNLIQSDTRDAGVHSI